jgi:hypothetical protein
VDQVNIPIKVVMWDGKGKCEAICDACEEKVSFPHECDGWLWDLHNGQLGAVNLKDGGPKIEIAE